MAVKVFGTYKSRRKRTDEEKKELRKKADQEYERMSELVDVIFKYYEGEGKLEFTYKWFAQENTTKYEFEGGKQYRIPLGVVEYVNSLGYPEREYGPTNPNEYYPVVRTKKIVKRFEFTPVAFNVIKEPVPNEKKEAKHEEIKPKEEPKPEARIIKKNVLA
jgi:hypothetical protein